MHEDIARRKRLELEKVDPKAAAFALTAEGFLNWCQGKPLTPDDFKCPVWAKQLAACNCDFCKGLRRIGYSA